MPSVKTPSSDKGATCSCMTNFLGFFVLWAKLAGRDVIVQSYENWSFFVFLPVLLFFPNFLGRLVSGLY